MSAMQRPPRRQPRVRFVWAVFAEVNVKCLPAFALLLYDRDGSYGALAMASLDGDQASHCG